MVFVCDIFRVLLPEQDTTRKGRVYKMYEMYEMYKMYEMYEMYEMYKRYKIYRNAMKIRPSMSRLPIVQPSQA